MLHSRPTASAMIGAPRKAQTLASPPCQPRIEEIELSAIRMIGRTIGAKEARVLGSLPYSLTSSS